MSNMFIEGLLVVGFFAFVFLIMMSMAVVSGAGDPTDPPNQFHHDHNDCDGLFKLTLLRGYVCEKCGISYSDFMEKQTCTQEATKK